jgi:hypothetical protein
MSQSSPAFCTFCNSANPPEAKFCNECAQPLRERGPLPEPGPPPVQANPVSKPLSEKFIIGFAIVFAVTLILMIIGVTQDRQEKAKMLQNAPLRVVNSKFEHNGFGAVAVWTVTFENRSSQRLGNIKYRTKYFAETGKQIDQGGVDALLGEYTIQKVIEPNSTRTLEITDGFIKKDVARGTFELVFWEKIN